MLELGRPGSAGTQRGELPVLRDGVLVARLRAANWRERATAFVGEREWVFAHRKRELTGRWAVDPEGTARLRARQASWWRGTWEIQLDGASIEMHTASVWRGTHRFLAGGRQVAETGNVGRWSSRPTLTADGSLPIDHQVFLLWVQLILRRRSAAGSTAAIGATVVVSS